MISSSLRRPIVSPAATADVDEVVAAHLAVVNHVGELAADDRHEVVGRIALLSRPRVEEADVVDHLAHVGSLKRLVDLQSRRHGQECARLDPFALDQRIGRRIVGNRGGAERDQVTVAHGFLEGVHLGDGRDAGCFSATHAMNFSMLARPRPLTFTVSMFGQVARKASRVVRAITPGPAMPTVVAFGRAKEPGADSGDRAGAIRREGGSPTSVPTARRCRRRTA